MMGFHDPVNLRIAQHFLPLPGLADPEEAFVHIGLFLEAGLFLELLNNVEGGEIDGLQKPPFRRVEAEKLDKTAECRHGIFKHVLIAHPETVFSVELHPGADMAGPGAEGELPERLRLFRYSARVVEYF